jgi:hypothetical protein
MVFFTKSPDEPEPIFLKTRRIELSNGVWHMVVRGCAQILC